MSVTDIQRQADITAISQLKARYCRFIDTKQWEPFRGLFAKDANFEGFGSSPNGANVDTFVRGVSGRLEQVVSIHHCHMPEIVFLDENNARGIWAMMDYLEWPEGKSPQEARGARGFCGYGHYEEQYRRAADGWKFSFLRLTRLRIDALSDDHPELRPVSRPHDPLWLRVGG